MIQSPFTGKDSELVLHTPYISTYWFLKDSSYQRFKLQYQDVLTVLIIPALPQQ